MNVEYEFYWYELDQPIEIGQKDVFYLFKNTQPPKFYAGLFDKTKAESAVGTVRNIIHPELGEITSIDTRGLDYTITLKSGVSFKVEAEQEPGVVYGYNIQPKEWTFIVEFERST